ncbi:MAG: metallophosphoesterase family protein [Terracidiphilus sp.]
MLLGIVSDTHGLLRSEAVAALRGVDRILHLGDVGKISILDSLARIAPVTAVRGNIDRGNSCARLPETEVVLIENPPGASLYLYMLHDLKTLHLDPAAAKFAAVLHGHTHIPNFFTRKGVLYFNPGSCGPRRFELPVSIGLLTISKTGGINASIISLIET